MVGHGKLIPLIVACVVTLQAADTPVYILSTSNVLGFTMPPGALPTTPATTWSTGTSGGQGLAYDPSSGSVYLAAGAILKFTSGGTRTTFVSAPGSGEYENLAVDASGNVYTDLVAGGAISLVYFTPLGVGPTTYVTGLLAPDNPAIMCFDAAGNLWVLANGKLNKIPPGGGSFTSVTLTTSLSSELGNLTIDQSGNFYVVTYEQPPTRLYKSTPCGTVSLLANLGNSSSIFGGAGVAYDVTSGQFYVVAQPGSNFTDVFAYSVNPGTGTFTLLQTAALGTNATSSITGPVSVGTPVCAPIPACHTIPGSTQWGGSACVVAGIFDLFAWLKTPFFGAHINL